MNLIGLIRLGRDAEIRYTNDGTPVAGLSAAWNYGKKGENDQRPTQWADLSLWGDRAEKLADYLKKGGQFYVVCSDVHIQTFERREGGTGSKLVGRIDQLEFAGGKRNEEGGQQQGSGNQGGGYGAPPAAAPRPAGRAPAPRPAAAQRPAGGSGFDDMDDDIPF